MLATVKKVLAFPKNFADFPNQAFLDNVLYTFEFLTNSVTVCLIVVVGNRKPKPLLKESIFLPIELADMVHFPNFKLLSPSSLYDLISLYIPSLLRHKVNQQGQEVDNQKGAFYIKKIIFILSF